MSKTVRIIALVLVALMILSLIPTVAFGAGPYTITVSPATGGSAKAEPTSANEGVQVTLTATAEPGYQFDHWFCPKRGIDNNRNSTLTFLMGAPDLEVTPVFVPIEYDITVRGDDNGTATADVDKAPAGATITLTPNPNPGYHFKGLQVNSSGVTIFGNSFTMPAGEVTVTAVFEKDVLYNVIVETDGNGSSISDPTKAAQGTTVSLWANPNDGYQIKEWQVLSGGVSISGNQFTMPAGDVKVKAIFEKASAPTGHFHDTAHLIFVDYEPATCVHAGHSAHYFCPFPGCGLTFDSSLRLFDPYIKPTGHRWSHWKVVRRPTPTQPGLERCFCYNKNCSAEKYFTIYYNENPKTGDESNMALWISLAAVALLGTAGAVWYIKRKKKN